MNIEFNSSTLSFTPSAQLSQVPTIGSNFNLNFSSDLTTATSSSTQINLFSVSNINLLRPIIKKRVNTTDRYSSKTQRTANQDLKTVQKAIASAKKLVIKASLLTKIYKEQSRLLNLLKIFREFTETEKVQSAFKVVATQIANLNISAKRLKVKARQLTKLTQSQPQSMKFQPTQI